MGNRISPSRSYLQHLPPEIKKYICSLIDKSSWSSLARTCKEWSSFFKLTTGYYPSVRISTKEGLSIDEKCPYSLYKNISTLVSIMGLRIKPYLPLLYGNGSNIPPVPVSPSVIKFCGYLLADGINMEKFKKWRKDNYKSRKYDNYGYTKINHILNPSLKYPEAKRSPEIEVIVGYNDKEKKTIWKSYMPYNLYWDKNKKYLVLGFVVAPILFSDSDYNLIIIRMSLNNYTSKYKHLGKYEHRAAGTLEAHCIYNYRRSEVKIIHPEDNLSTLIKYFYQKRADYTLDSYSSFRNFKVVFVKD